MSEENVARLRAVYKEWEKGDLRAGEDLYAQDITFLPMAEGRRLLDREGFLRFMQSFLGEWDNFTSEAVEITEYGDRVLVTERQHATGKGSGIEIDQIFYVVWTFRDGLVVSVRWDSELDEALAAAGLEP